MKVWACAALAALSFAVWRPAAAAPAMWVVEDGDSRIYLFGSMHMLSPGDDWRTGLYDAAYRQADAVWFEADMGAMDPASVVDLVARFGVDRRRGLSEKLSRRDLAALRAVLQADGVSLAEVEHLRPWVVALMLSTAPQARAGRTIDDGAEATVTRIARREAKPVKVFETLEEQIRVFADLSEAAEVEYLSDVLRSQTRRTWRLALPRRSLEQVWADGDVARLGKQMVFGMRAETPDFYDALLRRRNLAWADRLQAQMAGSGVELVNVGALHMVGPDSLPRLMAERGYTVRRVQ